MHFGVEVAPESEDARVAVAPPSDLVGHGVIVVEPQPDLLCCRGDGCPSSKLHTLAWLDSTRARR